MRADEEGPDEGPAPLELPPEAFRELGHRLVDRLADFLESVPGRPTARGVDRAEVCDALGTGGLPETGAEPGALLDKAADLLTRYSRLNGHPRSWGYVIGTPAPIGILGDFLTAAVNPNCTSWTASPAGAEMERQVVGWIAELLGYPSGCGGILVSGGNMANFVGFLAARRAKAGPEVRSAGVAGSPPMRVYASRETHTWIQKAADMSGLGTDAIRWIGTDAELRLDMAALAAQVEADRAAGERPFLVVGSAGTVSTGAVDPLPEIAAFCRERDLWFHVDGCYGAMAVAVAGTPPDLAGLREADSIAVDGHKWLFVPLEAGCALVRDPDALPAAFSYHPPYYRFHVAPGDAPIHYYEMGPQNSRALRAVKLWLAFGQAGRQGYVDMIGRNIALSREMHREIAAAPELEAATRNLSVTTFRYVPGDLDPADPAASVYLDELNEALLARLQTGGEVYLSNAVVEGRFLLRACIVNFRSRASDVRALPEIVRRQGAALDRDLRPAALGGGE